MARGVNKVILIGHLGADPELRYMPNGSPVVNLTVATSEVWKDKQTGEQQNHTEWHRVVLFSRLAEIACEYLRKGAKLYIEGRLQTRKWQDKNNQERYTTEIIGNDMQMLDSRTAAPQAPYPPSLSPRDHTSSTNQTNLTVQEKQSVQEKQLEDDDIPF